MMLNPHDQRFSLVEIKRGAQAPFNSIMLFGSFARGDEQASSDIDILLLSSKKRKAYNSGRYSFSTYTPEKLIQMAIHGSLFILHLKNEGIILEDKDDYLSSILARYIYPTSYEPLLCELRILGKLLDVKEDFYATHYKELNKIALYIFRTYIYADLASKGTPLFSLEKIRQDHPQYPLTLSILRNNTQNLAEYLSIRDWLSSSLGADLRNESESIEGLLIKHGSDSDLLTQLGIKILSKGSEDIGYL